MRLRSLVCVLVVVLAVFVCCTQYIFAAVHTLPSAAKIAFYRMCTLIDPPKVWTRITPAVGQALLVMLHGLNSHPIQFEVHRRRLKEEGVAWPCYVPFLSCRGNDTIDNVLNPVKDAILTFASQNGPDVPIIIWGHSNGARLAGILEVYLRYTCSNPVMISAVAGPFYGTNVIDKLALIPLSIGMVKRNVVDEMRYLSGFAIKVVQDMAAPTSRIRKHYFYGSDQDEMVRPVTTSLPRINCGETRIRLQGHSHISINDAVASHQIMTSIDFVRRCRRLLKEKLGRPLSL